MSQSKKDKPAAIDGRDYELDVFTMPRKRADAPAHDEWAEDPLLAKLREVHGKPRYDIAPELLKRPLTAA